MSKTSNPSATDSSTDAQVTSDDYSKADLLRYRRLTSFQQRAMKIIAEHGSPYGLKIKRELEDHYDEEVNHGRLYPNLDTVAEKGFVEKTERDKRTNDYALTDVGAAVLRDEIERDYREVVEA